MYMNERRNLPHFRLRYRALLFDLDGTLTDSAPGIFRCVSAALLQLGMPAPPQTDMRAMIGPPLHETFERYLGSPDLVEQAIAHYRACYAASGMYESAVYPGIPDLLADLHAAGARMLLATSKPQVYAAQIIEHFGLLPCFLYVGGASLDASRRSKTAVIGSVLGYLSPDERRSCVMIGDRQQDIAGAQAHGLPAIGVRYGYAEAGELEASQPALIVDRVADLRAVLLPEAPAGLP